MLETMNSHPAAEATARFPSPANELSGSPVIIPGEFVETSSAPAGPLSRQPTQGGRPSARRRCFRSRRLL